MLSIRATSTATYGDVLRICKSASNRLLGPPSGGFAGWRFAECSRIREANPGSLWCFGPGDILLSSVGSFRGRPSDGEAHQPEAAPAAIVHIPLETPVSRPLVGHPHVVLCISHWPPGFPPQPASF